MWPAHTPKLPVHSNWNTLDKQTGLVLRGAGILLIMLHNFTHWVPPVTGENEFSYEPRHVSTAFDQLVGTPLDAWRILFSFFGHYGVQIFVFLSAYGLTRSFMANLPGYSTHLWKRFRALYPTVIFAALLFLVYSSVSTGLRRTFSEDFVPLLQQLFLIGNFTGGGFTPIGPWWFLSMICQFYIVFPLLYRGMKRFGNVFLITVGGSAVLVEIFANAPITSATQINLNYLVIGHLPEFSFGMWAAYDGRMRAPRAWAILAATVFFAGHCHPYAWAVSGLAFTMVAVPLLRRLGEATSRLKTFLTLLGTVSLPLFLVNGFLRSPLVWFAQVAVERGMPLSWLSTFGLSLVFVVWAAFWAWCLRRIVQHCFNHRSAN